MPRDPTESERIATAIKELGLSYVVITSVDMDDLPDYGAKHFESIVLSIQAIVPDVKIELLTPDFKFATIHLNFLKRWKLRLLR